MTETATVPKLKIVSSMAEIEASDGIEFATITGFKPGELVRIGSLSAGDILEWVEANDGEAKKTAGLRLICKSLVDENGVRYASDMKNLAAFKRKSHKACEAVIQEILKLNGMTPKQDAETKKD